MARLTLDLSEQVQALLRARAATVGHATVEEHVAALIRADIESSPNSADEDPGAPEHLRVRSDADFEAKLLEGLNSPASAMGDANWDDMRRRFIERQRQAGRR